MKIAILAVQGAFIEHSKMLDRLGIESLEIRQKADLAKDYDGLIIPGGESTTMCKILDDQDMTKSIQEQIKAGMPVFGTCAGMIMLAKSLSNDKMKNFATMDITVMRNAYGRQLGSFYAKAPFMDNKELPMTFIRAPYVDAVGKDVEVLAKVGGKIVAVQQGNQLATSFHPELTEDTTVHEHFLQMVKAKVAVA